MEKRILKRNGRRGRELGFEVRVMEEARAAREDQRLGLFVWLRGWRRHPGRVFWELDPWTGEWRRI